MTEPPAKKSRLAAASEFLKSVSGIVTAVAAILTAGGTIVGILVARSGGGDHASSPATLQQTTPPVTSVGETESGSTTTRTRGAVAIAIGAERSGAIRNPGQENRYRFSARGGERLYFDALGACAGEGLDWKLEQEGGSSPVFDELYSSGGNCYDHGPVTLGGGGAYVLTVYSFKVWRAPVQTFAVRVGATVSPGVPRSGAGEIESPGASDVYRFAAPASGRVLLHAIKLGEACGAGESLNWTLTREGGDQPVMNELFYSTSCYDAGPLTLVPGATYELTVSGGPDGGSFGRYSFRIVLVA